MKKHFYQATAVMLGYVIGVGMFGVPFLAARSGLLSLFALLIGLGFVQYFVHLIYANVILETKTSHRMPGYAGLYLGKFWKHVTAFVKITGNIGGLLAYIIITGIFLNQLLGPHLGGNEFIYSTIVFLFEAIVVFFGISMMARVELLMSILLFFVIALISFKGLGSVDLDNYFLVDWKLFFLPYGAMLMALDGNGSLPIVSKLVDKDPKMMKKVVRYGTFIPMVVTALFVLSIVGISGAATTEDALSGINGSVGLGIVKFALVFGVITMVTSFLGVSEAIKETLWWDYGMDKRLAWAIAVFTPFILFVLGLQDLATVISFVGAIAGGMSAMILVLVFMKMKKLDKKLVLFKRKPGWGTAIFLICLFLMGLFYELWAFFANH